MIRLSSFDDLLTAARAQPAPQRLLLVFARIGLPDDATAEQRESFEAGRGGALTPVMCVDKDPAALPSFAALAADAEATGQAWSVVFATVLDARDGIDLSAAQVEHAMTQMIDAIGNGRIQPFALFDKAGRPLRLA